MENKKREAITGHDGDDEMEDETKMEMFYSLLRSFRDARDRRRRELEKNESSCRKKMKTKAEASFEWQDFTTEIHFRKPPVLFPKPVPCDIVKDNKGKRKEQQQQHQNHDDLDLNLAL